MSTTTSKSMSTSYIYANLYCKDDTMPLAERYINESAALVQSYPPFHLDFDVVVDVVLVGF